VEVIKSLLSKIVYNFTIENCIQTSEMKKILIVCVTSFLTQIVLAQSEDSIYFKITITRCTKKSIVFNNTYEDFEIAVKNSSSIIPLFYKDSIEIGMKIYVNRIKEEEKIITIVKIIILEKEKKGKWNPLITSEYFPLEELGNERSVAIGSNPELPDFFMRYKVSVLYNKQRHDKNKGILDLIPALNKKVNNH
jgi:hypothetical protein